mgnify:CR=1 FL=1
MNIETFIKELKNLNINATNQNLKDLEIYKDKLLEYNQKFNLTAIKQENEIYLKHFYDSLTLTKVIDLNQDLKIMDIGTGAGFPGLVLKIFYPNLDIVLVDSNHKKVEFLESRRVVALFRVDVKGKVVFCLNEDRMGKCSLYN